MHPDHGCCGVDEGDVVTHEPAEPCCEATEVLELVDAALDAIAQLVSGDRAGSRSYVSRATDLPLFWRRPERSPQP